MSLRRTRLKAVTNLPPRRKTQAVDSIQPQVEVTEKEVVVAPDGGTNQVIREEGIDEICKHQDIQIKENKFCRRVKPTVCLPPRKLQKAESVSVVCELDNVAIPVESVNQPVNNVCPSTPLIVADLSCKSPTLPQRSRFVKPNPKVLSGLIRQTSVHPSSASESEDDAQRLVTRTFGSPRVRNISESSVMTQPPSTPVPQVSVNSSVLPTKRKKPKFSYLARKVAEARREFSKKYDKVKPERSSLKMFDLIFYNPTTNPMPSKSKPGVEDVPGVEASKVEQAGAGEGEKLELNTDNEEVDDASAMPVPQVKIGLNGEIILDEKSLMIETTESKRGRETLQNSVPVFEDRNPKSSYYSRKARKSKDWTDKETKKFYKALNVMGTDFLLMQQLFPDRSRVELKNKFKREEKASRNLVDMALNNPSEFDISTLLNDNISELEAAEAAGDSKRKKRQNRGRRKANCYSMMDDESELDADEQERRMTAEEKQFILAEEKRKKDAVVNRLRGMYGLESIEEELNRKEEKKRKLQEEELSEEEIKRQLEEELSEEEMVPLNLCKRPVLEHVSVIKKVGKRGRKKRKIEGPIVYRPMISPEPLEVCSSGEEEPPPFQPQHRTITNEAFYQMLAMNIRNRQESTIQVQLVEETTEDGGEPHNRVELVLDNIPPREEPKQVQSVIIDNPSVLPREQEVENENMMVVVSGDGVNTTEEYHYMLVEKQEEIDEDKEEEIDEDKEEEVDEAEEEEMPEPLPEPQPEPATTPAQEANPQLLVCKTERNAEKMYLAGLSAGSFVFMSSATHEANANKVSMFMISERPQLDGSRVLSSIPVVLPPELVSSISQELDNTS